MFIKGVWLIEKRRFFYPEYLLNVSKVYDDVFHKRHSEGTYTNGYYDFKYFKEFLGL